MKYYLLVIAAIVSLSVFADKPVCYAESGGYCVYRGNVKQIYVNSNGFILFYFDTLMDEGEWEKAGVVPVRRDAASYRMSDNPDFAKLFYSTALAAQASNREVTIQMRGQAGGYLNLDRIWLPESGY